MVDMAYLVIVGEVVDQRYSGKEVGSNVAASLGGWMLRWREWEECVIACVCVVGVDVWAAAATLHLSARFGLLKCVDEFLYCC